MSKNNQSEYLRKMEPQRQRFGLRKLSVGVASVLLGTTFILGGKTVANADTTATAPANPANNTENTADGVAATAQQLQQSQVTLGQATNASTEATTNLKVSQSGTTSQLSPVQLAANQSTSISAQSTENTVAKMTKMDDSTVSVDISNAKQGDTYALVFHHDPHLTLDYTPGSFADSTIVHASKSTNQDGDLVYSGNFMKAGTINQPIVLNNDLDKTQLNHPGTYHSTVSFYYNGQEINTIDFPVTVPHDQAVARWSQTDQHGYPIPVGVGSYKYNEAKEDYYLVGGDGHHYSYHLNVTPNHTALDADGTTVEIPLARTFHVDNVDASTTINNSKPITLKPNQDFSYAINNHVLTISMSCDIHQKIQDARNVLFNIIGHYDDNNSNARLDDYPTDQSNLASNDGTGTVVSHFNGIGGKILSDSSLTNIPVGNIYQTDIKAFGDAINDVGVKNPYYLTEPHPDDKAYYVATVSNGTEVDGPQTDFAITIPDHYVLTSLGMDDANRVSDLQYVFSDGTSSNQLDAYKTVVKVTGKLQLDSEQRNTNKVSFKLVGHLDPNYAFSSDETLRALLAIDNGHDTQNDALTIQDAPLPPQTHDQGHVLVPVDQTNLEPQQAAGSVTGVIDTADSTIADQSAEFIVTIPANAKVSKISSNQFWEAPVVSRTADGRTQLTFKLKDGFTAKQIANIIAPYVYLSTADMYVSSMRHGEGTAELIMNGKRRDSKTFTIDMIAAISNTLTTAAKGNQDAFLASTAVNDDHSTGQTQLQYNLINGNADSKIPGAVFVGNVPTIQDGHSQFNMHITGPISIVDYVTQQNLNNDVDIYYSTETVDIATANKDDLTNFISQADVHDWSKIRSFKIVLKKALDGGKIYSVNVPAFVENQTAVVNKVGYLSSVVFGDGIMPFKVAPASKNSASLKVVGISTLHQQLHYRDASGTDHYIDLLASDDIKLGDMVDTLHVPTTLSSDGQAMVPHHYHWDEKGPQLVNSDATYPDGLENKLAQDNQVSQYYFDGDRIVWNLVADKVEDFTINEVVHYKYYGSNQPAAPDYTKAVRGKAYFNPLTNQLEVISLDEELPAVTAPVIDGYRPEQLTLAGYPAQEYSGNQLKNTFTSIDLSGHRADIVLNDYYINSAASLFVVDPTTHTAKLVETTYDDGTHQIKFQHTDRDLAKTGYDMHVYYIGFSSNMFDPTSGYQRFSWLYPYRASGSSSEDDPNVNNPFTSAFFTFKGYDSLTAALAGKYDGATVNGVYDDNSDAQTDSNGVLQLEPSQSFIVFYTPKDQSELQEQFLITSDNDPYANSQSKALRELAIPKTQADSAHSYLWSYTGKANTRAFVYENETFYPLSSYSSYGIDFFQGHAGYEDLVQFLNDHPDLGPTVSNVAFRPGYYIDQVSYTATDANGHRATYTIKLHGFNELLQLSNKIGQYILSSDNCIRKIASFSDDAGNQRVELDYNFQANTDDFTKVDDTHYHLDVYSDISSGYSGFGSTQLLSALNIFNGLDTANDGGPLLDDTLHEQGTPDPAPQVVDVHYAPFTNQFTVTTRGNVQVVYKDVTNMQAGQDGKYQLGGVVDPNGHVTVAPNYDLSSSDNKHFADDFSNEVSQSSSKNHPSYSYDSDGVAININFSADPSDWSSFVDMLKNGKYDAWRTYNMTPFNQSVGSDYVIVQEDPMATDGTHKADLWDPSAYATAGDPTGINGLTAALLNGGSTFSQTYYVYVKKRQNVDYQVLVEDKDGHTIMTVVGRTPLGYGPSNDPMTVGKANDHTTSLPDAYQQVKDNLGQQGYTVITQPTGHLKVSDDLTTMNFDDDTTKDQLLTIYVVQDKQAAIHYIDVNDSTKTSGYTPLDGQDLLNHLQVKSGLAGTSYQNTLWDYASAGYELADPNIPAGAKAGSFAITDPASRAYYIYLKHVTKPASETVTKTETIHYVYAGDWQHVHGSQAAPDYHAHTMFTRTGTKDLVTGQTAWNAWQPAGSYEFASVTSPTITDYTPNIAVVGKEQIKPTWKDIVHTVTYSFDPHHETVPPTDYDLPELTEESKTFQRQIKYRGTKDGGRTFVEVKGSPDNQSSYTQTLTYERDVITTYNRDHQVIKVEHGTWRLVDDSGSHAVASQQPANLGYDQVDIASVDGLQVADPDSTITDLPTVVVTYSASASNPGDNPGNHPGTNPGDHPGDHPGTNPGGNPGDHPGTNPGTNPGGQPGNQPSTNPGNEPGGQPTTKPSNEPGTPSTDKGHEPAGRPTTAGSHTNGPVQLSQQATARQQRQLPQTGNDNLRGLIALGAAGLMSMLGLVLADRKRSK